MRIYETTFIVNPQTDDASIDRDVSSVSNLITADGGKIVYENRMGTRRLAYPIEKLTQGYYTTLVFESESDILPKLERHYKLGGTYMRHLTIRFEGDVSKLGTPQEFGGPFEDSRDHRSRDGRPGDRRPHDNRPGDGRRTEDKPAPAAEPAKAEAAAAPEAKSTPAPAETAETKPVPTEDVKKADDTAPIETTAPDSNEDDEL